MLGVDLLRHIFAVFVIVIHMTSGRYSANVNHAISLFVDWIDGAVAGFFLISGFFSRLQTNLPVFFGRLAVRLVVPFFLFSLFYTFALFFLGKQSIGRGVIETLTLHGSGMQLYFLPYLLLIGVAFAFMERLCPVRFFLAGWVILATALLLLCFMFPTSESTGSSYRLIPFYFFSYILGVFYRFAASTVRASLAAASIVMLPLVLGFIDHRFFDVFEISLLFVIAVYASHFLPVARFPGSGGVYLMHTPLTNFAISTALMHVGIYGLMNVGISVALTYVSCLVVSLIFIRVFPKKRWLILE